MRSNPDFTDALTSLDWADRHIDGLAAELAEFAATKPYTLITERDGEDVTHIYLTNAKPITKLFAASVNAIIQAQPSSLDSMAVALAEANGAVDPTGTHFPVTKSEEGLNDKRTLKKLSALHPSDQKRILSLKPYRGWNDLIFALHGLNIERKHRRLGVIVSAPALTGFGGGNGPSRFHGMQTFEPAMLTNARYLVIAKIEGEMKFNFAVDVAFRDVPGTEARPPVLHLLSEFSAMCRQIAAYLT